jgi:hypothetical protein
MKVYQDNLPPTVEKVYAYPAFVGADVPARSKHNGLPAHSHSQWIGCDCEVTKDDLNDPKSTAYDLSSKYPSIAHTFKILT